MSKMLFFVLFSFMFINCNHSESKNHISSKTVSEANIANVDSLTVKVKSDSKKEITIGYTDEFSNRELLNMDDNIIVDNRVIEDYDGFHNILFPIPSEFKSININNKNSFFQVDTDDEKLNKKINFEHYYITEKDPITDPMWMYSKFINNREPNWWTKHKLRENKINSYFINKDLFLQEYAKKNHLDSSFFKLWQPILKYQKLLIRLNLPMIQKWDNSYLKELSALKSEFTHEEELSTSYYRRGLINLMLIINFLENGNTMNILNYQKSVLKNFNGKHSDFLLMELLIRCKDKFRDFNYTKGEYNTFLKSFMDICQTPKYKSYIEKANNIPVLTQKEALLKLDRSNVLLRDIVSNNKFSYIDFWASWCAPCRAEMPDSKKISEEYRAKNIQFVFVSIDENAAAWENAINRIGLPSKDNYLLLNGYESEIGRKFKISTIPRYMIIDNKGNIINADAPRPSDPKLKELFNKVLKNK